MGFFNRYEKEKSEREKREWMTSSRGPKFVLKRRWYTDKSTVGELFLKNEFLCHTLEDSVRDPNKNGLLERSEKLYGITAIPSGRHEVLITLSHRFKRRLPLLKDVPLFTGIRIHPGNTDEDTLGCILLGAYDASTPDWVGNSRVTFDRVFPKIEEVLKSSRLFLDIMGGPRYEAPNGMA